MAIGAFSPPKGWEDWATLLIGVWLCASPWVLQLADPSAMQNLVAVGFLVIIGELFTFYTLRIWEEWINIILGSWLVVSSWELAISTPEATANAIIMGLLLLALALYEIWDDWPAAGSADTELSVMMEPEVCHGEAEVYTRVQA